MKRGLVLLDPAEIPAAQWRDRVATLQRRMRAEGVDVALIYGDVSRSDDIAYLTNLCIYWNEGVLAVPADGDPVFLTKLSQRVHPWMRRTSTVTDVRSGKSFGPLIAGYLHPPDGQSQDGHSGDGAAASTVGLVDARLWPSAVIEEIAGEVTAVPGLRVKHLGGMVREQRLLPSAHELALLRHAADVLAGAADQAARPGLTATARAAIVERELRGAGFLDVLARTGDAADGAGTLQVTGQYRNLWVHVSRLVTGNAGGGDGSPGWPGAMRDALGAAVRAAGDGVSAAQLTAVAGPALAGLPPGAASEVRWVNQADMASGGEYADYPADL
ncbi:MAG TPA: aminopeptidase P family N-terminal domain-containing protein, partial [Actinospica sp.]|nr:aminopeptidase P family N-terminal domain-containing protein [Actinospica sp.]